MKEIIEYLKENKLTISTMESCTGGYIANSITNIEGASDVFSFGAITYSNEYKIKFDVSKDIIDKYSVYSIETAKEMSRAISLYTNSNYGVGITGKLNKIDKNNLFGNNNTVHISLYDRDNEKYYTLSVVVDKDERIKNKEIIANLLCNLIKDNLM